MKKVADKMGLLRIRVQTPVMVGILGFVLCVMLSWNTCVFGQTRKLVLNTAFSSPITSPDKTGFLDLLYRELFNRLNIPFERRLILYIMLFSSVAALCGTAVQIHIEYRRDMETIEESLRQIEKSYLKGISEGLWSFNSRSCVG